MKVICISGKARHGKDTAANYLKKKLIEKGNKVLIVHYADLLKYICKNIFNWDGKKNEDGRRLLQYIGTDVIRKQNPDYWVDFVISILSMFNKKWDCVLIPDCRFPNEVEKLRKYNFDTCCLQIIRNDFAEELTPEQQQHKSETAMDNFEFNYVIHNSEIEQFYKSLDGFLEGYINGG